jgi:hypothetical protein
MLKSVKIEGQVRIIPEFHYGIIGKLVFIGENLSKILFLGWFLPDLPRIKVNSIKIYRPALLRRVFAKVRQAGK